MFKVNNNKYIKNNFIDERRKQINVTFYFQTSLWCL